MGRALEKHQPRRSKRFSGPYYSSRIPRVLYSVQNKYKSSTPDKVIPVPNSRLQQSQNLLRMLGSGNGFKSSRICFDNFGVGVLEQVCILVAASRGGDDLNDAPASTQRFFEEMRTFGHYQAVFRRPSSRRRFTNFL